MFQEDFERANTRPGRVSFPGWDGNIALLGAMWRLGYFPASLSPSPSHAMSEGGAHPLQILRLGFCFPWHGFSLIYVVNDPNSPPFLGICEV